MNPCKAKCNTGHLFGWAKGKAKSSLLLQTGHRASWGWHKDRPRDAHSPSHNSKMVLPTVKSSPPVVPKGVGDSNFLGVYE